MELKIPIPKKAKILVKEGEKVEFNRPIFEVASEKEIEIDINRQLKIPNNKIFDYLKKFIGDEVKKDEVLAEKKGFFLTKKVFSPQSGVVKEINHENGTLILSSLLNKKTFNAYFQGKIKTIAKNELIVFLPKTKIYPIKIANDNFGGECFYFSPNQPVDAELVEKKIVVASAIDSFEQLKIEALGAAGIVTVRPLPNQAEIPFCYLKNLPDFEEIKKTKLSACTINKDGGKIFFYD
jgi:hypothetical protein